MKFLAALWLGLGAVAVGAAAPADTTRPGDSPEHTADAALMSLADHYFDNYYFPENPTAATTAGIHRYDERLILDEGFGQPGAGADGKRQSQLLRLGQLQDALLPNVRYIVAIKMHTGQMTLDQAIDFFVTESYQSRQVGEVETKRGTSDPTYLYYTLGKLQILKLRSDLQAREGSGFRLKDFHDAFMQQGFPPIRMVRRALLHDDSPTL